MAARLLTVEEFATYSYMLVLAVVFSFVSEIGVPIVAGRDVSAGRALAGGLCRRAAGGGGQRRGGRTDSAPLRRRRLGAGSTLVPALLVAAFVLFNRLFEFQATILRSLGRFNTEAAIQAAGAPVFIGGATAVTVAGLAGVSAVLAVLCAKEAISALVAYPGAARGPPALARPAARPLAAAHSRGHQAVGGRTRACAWSCGCRSSRSATRGPTRRWRCSRPPSGSGDAAWLLATTAGVALLPGVAYLAQSERARARGLLRRVLLTAAGASAVVAVAAQPLAESAMRLIFGGDFASGGEVLGIVLAGLPAYVVLGISWYAVVAFDGEPRLLGVGLAGLAVSAAATLALVPGGADGAGWAYVVAFYAMAALSLGTLARQLEAAPAGEIRPPGLGPV